MMQATDLRLTFNPGTPIENPALRGVNLNISDGEFVTVIGTNGAGKSTLYQILDNLKKMPRVNTDEIVKELGDWRNTSDVLKAGKIAVQLIDKYFSEGISFNQESTLCGKSIIKNFKRAKQLGYTIELHYVGVDSVETAKRRVAERVQNGGHGIPESDIEKRYFQSFSNLQYLLKECDLAVFYDNSNSFHRFAIFRRGKIVRLSQDIPQWFDYIIY